MLAALTEDPEFLIQSISLEASLTRSYKVPREVDSNLNTLEKQKVKDRESK